MWFLAAISVLPCQYSPRCQCRQLLILAPGPYYSGTERRDSLPQGVTLVGASSREELRARYQSADAFVFPSFFEGMALVILEAMACGLPVITTHSSGGGDIIDESNGQIVPTGDVDALIEAFRRFALNRDRLLSMRTAARARAETFTWERYRSCVNSAVAALA